MSKLKEHELLENKALREKMIEEISVLEKVKNLLLLPNTDIATTKQVAEYFEVDFKTVSKAVDRNREELTSSGLKFMKYSEIKELLNSDIMSQLKISRQGTNVFSKRAILNLAMLLRDSEIAKEIRQALLDQQEVISNEQKVQGIELKQQLQLAVINAKDDVELMLALRELENYNNRHIAELNVNIQRMKPKEEAFDTFIDGSNYQKMANVAKSLGIGRNKLFEFLRIKKVLMSDNTPYQSYINNGWFVVKQTPVNKGYRIENVHQTYVTAKGINGISKLLNNK